jgi:transposase
MAKALVSDQLWALLAPLLPSPRPRPKGGRPPVEDRKALAGIVFVLKSGIPWEMLPQEMGCGCGMTCWRRLRDWQRAGVWARLHRVLLDRLGAANAIDWSRCSLDSASVAAKRGARSPARTRPTAASPARSGTWWSMPGASPSPWS